LREILKADYDETVVAVPAFPRPRIRKRRGPEESPGSS